MLAPMGAGLVPARSFSLWQRLRSRCLLALGLLPAPVWRAFGASALARRDRASPGLCSASMIAEFCATLLRVGWEPVRLPGRIPTVGLACSLTVGLVPIGASF